MHCAETYSAIEAHRAHREVPMAAALHSRTYSVGALWGSVSCCVVMHDLCTVMYIQCTSLWHDARFLNTCKCYSHIEGWGVRNVYIMQGISTLI
jgi:uncharacterized protein YerC